MQYISWQHLWYSSLGQTQTERADPWESQPHKSHLTSEPNYGRFRLIFSVPFFYISFSYFTFPGAFHRIFLLFPPRLSCHFYLVVVITTTLSPAQTRTTTAIRLPENPRTSQHHDTKGFKFNTKFKGFKGLPLIGPTLCHE